MASRSPFNSPPSPKPAKIATKAKMVTGLVRVSPSPTAKSAQRRPDVALDFAGMRLRPEAHERDDQHDGAADKAEGGLMPRQPVRHRLDAESGDGAEGGVGERRSQPGGEPHDDAAFQGAADAEQADRPHRRGDDDAEQDSTHQNRQIFHAELPQTTLTPEHRLPKNAAEYAHPARQPKWRIERCGVNPSWTGSGWGCRSAAPVAFVIRRSVRCGLPPVRGSTKQKAATGQRIASPIAIYPPPLWSIRSRLLRRVFVCKLSPCGTKV